MNQWWIIVAGVAYTPAEYTKGWAFNGKQWVEVPRLLPAIPTRTHLDLAMQVAAVYDEIRKINREYQL